MSEPDDFTSRLARSLWLHKAPVEDRAHWEWDEVSRSDQLYWHMLAIAAVHAIREPTPKMCEAAGIANAAEVWRRMADAAANPGDYEPELLDPTKPLPPEQVEEAYRRGYQQASSFMLSATERYVEERHRKKLQDWVGKTLFKWRYGFKGRGISAAAPIPPYTADS